MWNYLYKILINYILLSIIPIFHTFNLSLVIFSIVQVDLSQYTLIFNQYLYH